jgi:DNA-directed RNA polymerase specialized sigma24 family protein
MPVTSPDLEHSLEGFRDYLHLLARMHIDPRLRRDCDPSDVVQSVMLKAHQGIADFRGDTPEKMGAWLRQILATPSPICCVIGCEPGAISAAKRAWNTA